MTCKEAQRIAWEERNAAGEADAARYPAMRSHLTECPACAAADAEHIRLQRMLGGWQLTLEASPEFDRRLRERIAAAEARRPWRWARGLTGAVAGWREGAALAGGWLRTRAGGVAAAAVLGVVLMGGGTWLYTHSAAPAHPTARSADAAVHDLQVLDKDSEMLENFDLISEQPLENSPSRIEQSGGAEVANP